MRFKAILARAATLAAALAVTLALAACSNSQGYEAMRAAGQAKAQCEREQTVSAQCACEAPYQTGYDEYQAQREEVVDDD